MRPVDLLLVTLGLIKVDFKEDFLDCRGAFEDGALGTDMVWSGLAWPGAPAGSSSFFLLQTE